MRDSEAWATVCHPLPQRNYRTARRRALSFRVFATMAILALITGALIAVNF